MDSLFYPLPSTLYPLLSTRSGRNFAVPCTNAWERFKKLVLSAINECNRRNYVAINDDHMPTGIMLFGNSLCSKVVSASANSWAAIAVRRAFKEARRQSLHGCQHGELFIIATMQLIEQSHPRVKVDRCNITSI